jgi:hypothetical protein
MVRKRTKKSFDDEVNFKYTAMALSLIFLSLIFSIMLKHCSLAHNSEDDEGRDVKKQLPQNLLFHIVKT